MRLYVDSQKSRLDWGSQRMSCCCFSHYSAVFTDQTIKLTKHTLLGAQSVFKTFHTHHSLIDTQLTNLLKSKQAQMNMLMLFHTSFEVIFHYSINFISDFSLNLYLWRNKHRPIWVTSRHSIRVQSYKKNVNQLRSSDEKYMSSYWDLGAVSEKTRLSVYI